MVKANFNIDTFVITVFWQVCLQLFVLYLLLYMYFKYVYIQVPSCIGNITVTKYHITVMDQYSAASITVPANMSSVEISEFPNNGTSIVANREYIITVSAISDQGTSYPSDPVIVGKL